MTRFWFFCMRLASRSFLYWNSVNFRGSGFVIEKKGGVWLGDFVLDGGC